MLREFSSPSDKKIHKSDVQIISFYMTYVQSIRWEWFA